MKTLRWLSLALLTIAVSLSVLPGVAYLVALNRVEGRPVAADPAAYTTETIGAAWALCREPLPLSVYTLNPWQWLISFHDLDIQHRPPGERAAAFVARRHNAGNPQTRNSFWWHASNAALMIWITRHWTAEQLGATVVRDGLCQPQRRAGKGVSQ